MELWVRSQNKESLIKVDGLRTYYTEISGESVYEIEDCKFNTLGSYKSKERLLEVLDEIQKLIKPTFKINYEYDDSHPIIDGEWLKSLKAESKIEELSCYVYEMPKE